MDGAVLPDAAAIHKIRQKVLGMRKTYSPEKKVSSLLRVCKLIYAVMQDNSGGGRGQNWFNQRGSVGLHLCCPRLAHVSATPTGLFLSASFQAGCTVPTTSCPC